MEVLSVFDQSNKDKNNRQVLKIDENSYANDTEMKHILHRLLAAASDSKLRQDMNVEDEYFSAIENRDTAIMMRDKKIAQQNEHIAQQNEHIAQQSEQIEHQNEQIEHQNEQIAQQEKALLATAKALKDTGMPIDQIADMTNLPLDKIQIL